MKIKVIAKDNYRRLNMLGREFELTKGSKADMCIAVGGDGTFMKAAEAFDGPILPIRGDEKGSSGFYADISLRQLGEAVKLIKKGAYTVETLSKKIMITYNGKNYYAVNEALLKSADEEVYFSIYKRNGHRRSRVYPFIMAGDGMLAASAVGSTAYNKSANGPILLTDKVLCLTFLNPDGPYKNPIVIDADSEIDVKVEKYNGILRYDNKKIALLKPGESFSIRISGRELRVVKLKGIKEPIEKKLERLIMKRTAQNL